MKLVKSDFFKNASLLFSGSLIAQGIGFGALYFLGRMYSPEDFGEVETLMKIAGVFIAIAGLRYEMAIVVEEDNHNASDLLRLSLFINAVISFLLLICHWYISNSYCSFFQTSKSATPSIFAPDNMANQQHRVHCVMEKSYKILSENINQ